MTTTTEADNSNGVASATTFSAIHTDIIESHILPRLDGPSLASAACCSATLRRLSSHRYLWRELCRSTWPSTSCSPFLLRLISDEPHRFFSLANSTIIDIDPRKKNISSSSPSTPSPSELISAVDIFYRDELIFSKVQETETETSWFKCSPFRIDMLDTKEAIPTDIELVASNDDVVEHTFRKHMTLSWLLIDPEGHRVINLSSKEPVSVQRHWLTGEIQLKYAVILGHVQCVVLVNCGGTGNDGGDQNKVVIVKEVSLEMEDMDGKHLNGRDSLGILQRSLRGKTGRGGENRAELCKRRYENYLEKKREQRERKVRIEMVLDALGGAFLVFGFVAFLGYVLWR